MSTRRSFAAEHLFRTLAQGRDLELLRESLDARMFWAYKRGERVTFRVWLRDRLAFLGHVLLYPWRRLRASKRAVDPAVLVLDTAAADAHHREVRTYFFEQSAGQHPGFVGYDATVPQPPSVDRRGLRRAWFGALGVAFLGLVDPAPVRLSYIGRAYRHALDIVAMGEAVERVYVFMPADPIMYLAATYLKSRAGRDVWLVAGNTPLYRWLRVCHLRAPIVLCSQVQKAELEHFAVQGVNQAGPAVYAGNEYALDLVDADRTPKCELGYFSSGMWARIGGLARTDDIDGIAAGRYADNVFYRKTEEILSAMADLAREREWRMVIYLHPYERLLLKQHGIEPPYASLADGVHVVLDTAEGSSRPRMWEPIAAVSLQSTFIWERLDAGLSRSYVYRFEDQSLNGFDPEALGPFAGVWFSDMHTLRERLVDAIANAARAE